jgi:AraC family transcriptional regulator
MCVARAASCANETKAWGTQLNGQPNDVSTRWAYGSYEDPLPGDSDGRRSLYLRIVEVAPYLDPVELPTFSDPAITLVLNRGFRIDTFSEGRWRGTKYTRGTGKLTPARQGRLIRHHFENQKNLTLLHLILPQNTVDLVAAEVPKAGTTLRSSLSNVSFLADPLITNVMFSAVAALRDGAPDFYAQAVAQWLAAHLLLGPSAGFEWSRSLAKERISDYRMVRVLEYIEAHLSERLDLRVLAKEAGISPFHFAALFNKAVGATPHRHVQHLRMQAAKAMLRDTDKSILDIALSCGFGSASHFAAAFRRHFLQSPTEFRSSLHRFRLVHHLKIESDSH